MYLNQPLQELLLLAFFAALALPAAPGQDVIPCTLRRGWNEVLVKVENGEADWGFYFELLDAEGNSMLEAVKIAIEPPARR